MPMMCQNSPTKRGPDTLSSIHQELTLKHAVSGLIVVKEGN